jgi:glutaredoxin
MASVNVGNPQTPKRWFPIIAIVAIWIFAMHYLSRAAVEPVNCSSERSDESFDVVMLSASWCQYCRRARQYFVSGGINYCEWDIERSERGAALYKQSKYKGIPIIYIADNELVGFNREQIARLLTNSAEPAEF